MELLYIGSLTNTVSKKIGFNFLSMKIKISNDFSVTPGPRFIKEGHYSGELFLTKILREKYKQAISSNLKLMIDLDDTAGYATSFLEESFGGLQREYPQRNILKDIDFISNDEPDLISEITDYINEAVSLPA